MLHKKLWHIAQAGLLITLLGSGFGCGEDIPETPEERCDYFVETYCSRQDSCGNQGKSNCVSEARLTVNCGQAIDTSPQYERCIRDLEESSCGALSSALPASCINVITTR